MMPLNLFLGNWYYPLIFAGLKFINPMFSENCFVDNRFIFFHFPFGHCFVCYSDSHVCFIVCT